MADAKNAPVSFDAIIQEGRKKRKAEQLAAEIFSKNRRSSAPPTGPKVALGGSLASRVGVTKRPSSLTRSTTPRQANTRPPHLNRPPLAPAADSTRPRPSYTQSFSGTVSEAKSNARTVDDGANGGAGISFKGAASGPYTVIAQNFAPGTTAADIESVMQSVGGQMMSCRVIAANPTVIAELAFVEKAGAEKVIDTFDGKKADGRPLYVYWKGTGTGRVASAPPSEPPTSALGAGQADDVAMDVDENAASREAQNRLREERRGRDDRAQRDAPRDVFPTGPRSQQRSEPDPYYRGDDRRGGGYQDSRYGYGGGYRDGGRGGRGANYGRGRDTRYGGQTWRP